MKEIKCKITGEVQGVFMRDYVYNTALTMEIVGTVENRGDGSVEIFAQGYENKLNDFLNAIKVGSPEAKVQNVEVEWRDAYEILEDFKVL